MTVVVGWLWWGGRRVVWWRRAVEALLGIGRLGGEVAVATWRRVSIVGGVAVTVVWWRSLLLFAGVLGLVCGVGALDLVAVASVRLCSVRW